MYCYMNRHNFFSTPCFFFSNKIENEYKNNYSFSIFFYCKICKLGNLIRKKKHYLSEGVREGFLRNFKGRRSDCFSNTILCITKT